ncbi:hypothetical protein B0A49_08000 [Cryomyces minteri]|uniref:Uncharacterized protein n=2 Tax=Cryomyces minteri TaxID=331657 RepID=A0A4U0WI65_9PEZI|nr:hypothetical protein B0A49_08000 [Cryomyces minteri]
MHGPATDTASVLSQGSSSIGRSAYNKGPGFTLDTFSSKDFIVRDFVEALSSNAVPASRRSGASTQAGAFDPKPLIRTFEHALSRLKTLSEDLELHENELSSSVRRAEIQHKQNVNSLARQLEHTIDSFQQLDNSLNGNVTDGDADSGGNVAVKIGERLEELDRQRQRAQDVKFLIQCWLEVSERGDLSSLEDVRRLGGGDGKIRCAHIARQLLKISTRVDPEGSPVVNGKEVTNGVNGANGTSDGKAASREIIERFLEMLEKDLLNQFDDFYRRQNFDGMKECALALRDFGEGASVMGLFVNQHQFFIDRSQLITEEVAGDTETWDRLADPDTEPPGVEPSLQSLVDEVRVVVEEESFIIKRAFPFYDEVLVRFVQRIFQQSIQQRLEMVLDKANSISSLAFLRSLQAARSYIGALVEDLKTHGLTEHPEPVSSQMSAILDQQLDDLFVPYFAGSSYIEREKKNLDELYSSLLFKFTTYHSRRPKKTTTYLASLGQRSKELIASARDAYMERLDSSDLPASQKAMLVRIAGLRDADTSSANKNEIDVTEEDGALSLPNAKRMLKWLAEGVGRGLELSGGNETPKDVKELLNLLLANMGELYLDTALDAADGMAASQESAKGEPDLSYILDLRAAIGILHLMVTCIHTVLIPLAASNLTIRRDLEKSTTNFVNRMEEKVNSIMQRTVDASLTYVSKILNQQKRSDFRPRDDSNFALDELQTPTCLNIINFLSKLRDRVAQSFDGRNLKLLLTELAIGIRSLLLTHFKSYQVNLTGGLVVSKDITKYIEILRTFPLAESFEPSLEVLAEIANLFVIGPEALRDRLRGGSALAGIDKADLRPYIQMREDARSVGVQAVLNAM